MKVWQVLRVYGFIILIITILTACAPMPVKIVAEKPFDSNDYKTYSLLPNEQDDIANLGMDKTTTNAVIEETINNLLSDKGYRKNSDNPDMLISYYLVSNAKTDKFVVNQYYSELGYHPAPGRSSTRDSLKFNEVTYEEGILIVDIIDAKTKQRVWQAYLTSRTDIYKSEQRKENRLRNAVIKILSYIPDLYKP